MGIEAFRKRVGRLIRSAREKADLTQDQLAAKVSESLTKSLMSRYECGFVLPGFERLKEMLAACGVEFVPPLIEAGYREASQVEPNAYGQVFATESAKEFVEAWFKLRSIDAVADELGMTRKQVHDYAVRLRQKGLKLPRATPRKSRSKEDIAELKLFLDSLAPGDEDGMKGRLTI